MNENLTEEIKELTEKLKKARESYYNLAPEISDEEYDNLKEKLKLLEPENEEVKAVGAKPPSDSIWEKVKHEIPMGSLNKVNSEEEFNKWIEKIKLETNKQEFVVTHKIDGASLELIYENGKLSKGLTRGDGITGENITENILNIPNIPKTIKQQGAVVVRGEVYMDKNTFKEKYANKYANPRNTASSKMREKKNLGKDCENLLFLAYWIKSEKEFTNMTSVFQELKTLGFETPEILQGKPEEIKLKFKEIEKNRNSIPYEIDGTVVSIDNLQALSSLGEVAMRPKGQIAWKFESEKATSRVQNVVWQVGPSGRISPVAIIDPTSIGGVTITRISLHNLKMFNELKLFKGCNVLIERRNDVIPYLSANLDNQSLSHIEDNADL